MKLKYFVFSTSFVCSFFMIATHFCSVGDAQEASTVAVVAADPSPTQVETSVSAPSPIVVEPLAREQIDIFFDSLRASSPYTPPPVRVSQKVNAAISGIWSGVVFDPEGELGELTLRFRPSIDERLKRAETRESTIQLAESVDLTIRLGLKGLQFSHSMAKDPLLSSGFLAPLKLDNRGKTRTAFIKGAQDSGMYLSVPAMFSTEAAEDWGVLICPRAARFAKNKELGHMQLELVSSPYELSEIKMTMTANASSRMPTLNSKERLKMAIATTDHMPAATMAEDEEISVSPSLQVAYHPNAAIDFFRFAPHTSIQQGLRIMSETENQAGHIRRAYFATTLYVQKLMEPSPVSVVIDANRVARDEGICYVVQRRKTRWAEYDKTAPTRP